MVENLTLFLERGSVIGILLAFSLGAVTSINPCFLSMLPLILGYIGGYGAENRRKGFLLSLFFVLGLALTIAFMGIVAASLGLVFGQGIGGFWPYITGCIALLMGLNLLGFINFNFPGIASRAPVLKGLGGAFLLGLTFGFVASPCATPILAVLLTFIAAAGKPLYGGAALFAYGFGQGLPLIVAGTFTSVLATLDKAKKWGQRIKMFCGLLLVIFGIYLLLYA
ncbi:MAG: cytochrome c biogenesis protein CcdA [Clostridia bacterium]|nr:cytochrome c biogenesis protein CcdA [Clostridia bacterium]